jgi:hypothetical protein
VKKVTIAVLIAACAAAAGGQNGGQGQPPSPAPAQGQTQQAHPRRVQAKLDGFDLAPDKATANQIGGASRGAPGKLLLCAPHKGRVYTLRPSFWWQGDPAATYKFHIQDVTGQFVLDRDVTGTSLPYPSDAPPLEPGKTYLWRVHSDSPLMSPPPPAAMIVVVGGDERVHLETGESELGGAGFDAEAARAKYLFDQRLWYDSVMAYSELIGKYPDQRSLYEMRGSMYDQLPVSAALADADYARAQ